MLEIDTQVGTCYRLDNYMWSRKKVSSLEKIVYKIDFNFFISVLRDVLFD